MTHSTFNFKGWLQTHLWTVKPKKSKQGKGSKVNVWETLIREALLTSIEEMRAPLRPRVLWYHSNEADAAFRRRRRRRRRLYYYDLRDHSRFKQQQQQSSSKSRHAKKQKRESPDKLLPPQSIDPPFRMCSKPRTRTSSLLNYDVEYSSRGRKASP